MSLLTSQHTPGDKQQQKTRALGEIALNGRVDEKLVGSIKTPSKAPAKKSKKVKTKSKVIYQPVPKAVKLAAQIEDGLELIDVDSNTAVPIDIEVKIEHDIKPEIEKEAIVHANTIENAEVIHGEALVEIVPEVKLEAHPTSPLAANIAKLESPFVVDDGIAVLIAPNVSPVRPVVVKLQVDQDGIPLLEPDTAMLLHRANIGIEREIQNGHIGRHQVRETVRIMPSTVESSTSSIVPEPRAVHNLADRMKISMLVTSEQETKGPDQCQPKKSKARNVQSTAHRKCHHALLLCSKLIPEMPVRRVEGLYRPSNR